MELEIKSIGKVERANIHLDSISVIAGYNGSGKTTISKCLYGMLELMQEDRIDKDAVFRYWSMLFGSQMATFGRDELDYIKLIDGDRFLSFSRVLDDKLNIYKSDRTKGSPVVYLRSPSRWSDAFSDQLRDQLEKPISEDAFENLQEFQKILDANASGHLRKKESGYVYIDEDFPEYEIPLDNTASGVLIFLELSRLIGNGTIVPNSVLIIDEPETNLHPEKQVALARVLTLLASQFNIKLFLSSHNIYFIRSLEVSIQEEGLENAHFYSMRKDPASRLYIAEDVSDNTEKIYDELYKPMEDL